MTSYTNEELQALLVDQGYLSKENFDQALKDSEQVGIALYNYLFQKNYISKDILGQAYAESLGVPYADLNSNPVNVLAENEEGVVLDQTILEEYRVVIFIQNKKEITFATDDPKKEGLKAVLKPLVGRRKMKIAYSLSDDIDATLVHFRKPMQEILDLAIENGAHIASSLIHTLFEEAFARRASDIHLEPYKEDIHIRFRIDGKLVFMGKLPTNRYDNVLNRLKVLADMRIDEHFKAQDGSIHYDEQDLSIDLRISIIPILHGEKVVIRVLSQYVQDYSLIDLGLSPGNQALLNASSSKPFGMIIVTGPTGSGKSTTLYSLLKSINRSDINVTTIEDPIEYKMPGINQIQVNQDKQLTFASGLRSIVRQDPDIILVGEIRDEETAEIAVNAALTGHLLLSTFHANDSVTAIPRLLDMGVEPFLLSSTLDLLIAQRLVRKISEQHKVGYETTGKEIEKLYPGVGKFFPKTKKITLYKPHDSNADGAYYGRTAIFEVVQMTTELKNLILTNPSANEIWKVALKNPGTKTLFEDGLEKVKQGVTSLEELLRVAKPPET